MNEPERAVTEMVYLSSPYTHDDPLVREARFIAVAKYAAYLIAECDMTIFSPIAHSHPICLFGQLDGEWERWETFDRRILDVVCGLIVLCLPGWDTSRGIAREIRIHAQHSGFLSFHDPPGWLKRDPACKILFDDCRQDSCQGA